MSEEEDLFALQAANRHAPDGQVERRLLQQRAALFTRRTDIPSPRSAGSAPALEGQRFGLPVTTGAALRIDQLRDALSDYGALHVRGLLDRSQVEQMRGVIDSVLGAQAAAHGGAPIETTSPWFEPFGALNGGGIAREFVRASGSVLGADSPRGLFQLLEILYELGIDRLITEFFGERPALSAEKTTLRKVVPGIGSGGWHQDGQFLGTNIRSLDVWIALSDCGVDAAGLELVPTRLNHIVQTGTAGAEHDWCASHDLVEAQFAGALIRPQFKAGDALLFDHFLMHRTWRTAAMSKTRYAIESWFFAPSAYPENQTGLYV